MLGNYLLSHQLKVVFVLEVTFNVNKQKGMEDILLLLKFGKHVRRLMSSISHWEIVVNY